MTADIAQRKSRWLPPTARDFEIPYPLQIFAVMTVTVTGWVVSPEFLVRIQIAVPDQGLCAVREGYPLSTGKGGFESLIGRQLCARIPSGYEPEVR